MEEVSQRLLVRPALKTWRLSVYLKHTKPQC